MKTRITYIYRRNGKNYGKSETLNPETKTAFFYTLEYKEIMFLNVAGYTD